MPRCNKALQTGTPAASADGCRLPVSGPCGIVEPCYREPAMTSTLILLGTVDIVLAVVTIALAIPLARGRIPMNELYGIRLRKAFESEQNWYRINAYGGRQLVWWSVPMLVIGAVSFFLPVATQPALVALPALALVCPAVAVLAASRHARRI